MNVANTLRNTFFALAILLTLTGCEGCEKVEKEPDPWIFSGETADYEVVFPGNWVKEAPGSINPHADLAAGREDTYFFMVIPQELPTFPRPDIHQFQRTALERLSDTVKDFVIKRQGAIELGEESGLTVFASGVLNEREISYITSYVIRGDVGFQLIAFAEVENEAVLISEMDLILSTWKFTDGGDAVDGREE